MYSRRQLQFLSSPILPGLVEANDKNTARINNNSTEYEASSMSMNQLRKKKKKKQKKKQKTKVAPVEILRIKQPLFTSSQRPSSCPVLALETTPFRLLKTSWLAK